jgi:integrase
MPFVFKPSIAEKGGKAKRRGRYYWASYADPVTGEKCRHVLKLPSGERLTSREAAQAELKRLLILRELLAAGLTTQYVESAREPVRKLAAGYVRHLRNRRGRNGRRISRSYLDQVIQVCRWMTTRGIAALCDLNPAKIEAALSGLSHLGKSAKTVKAYRSIMSGLCKYGVKTARVLESNAVDMTKAPGDDPVKERRALTPNEAAALLEAVNAQGKQGESRKLWYEVALFTGLRVKEIRLLTWGRVHLDSLPARIAPRATAQKANRADVVTLKASIADKLRAARPDDAGENDPVFKTTPTLRTFHEDCRRAGIAVARNERGFSDLDRHALRTTYTTWLARADVSPQVLMKMARHSSIAITMKHYVDGSQLDTAAAAEKLPDLDAEPMEAVASIGAKTGTDESAVVSSVVPTVVSQVGAASCEMRRVGSRRQPATAISRASRNTSQHPAKRRNVGAKGFEPSASWSQTRRSNQTELRPGRSQLYD